MDTLAKIKRYNGLLKAVPGLLKADVSSNVIALSEKPVEPKINDQDIDAIWAIAVKTFNIIKFKKEVDDYFNNKIQ